MSSKEGCNYYHLFKVFGKTRLRIDPSISPTRGGRSSTTPLMRSTFVFKQCVSSLSYNNLGLNSFSIYFNLLTNDAAVNSPDY